MFMPDFSRLPFYSLLAVCLLSLSFTVVFAEGISGVSAMPEEGAVEDNFFDADDLVPQGEMSKRGPINVDPSHSPASSSVIVRKKYGSDTKDAQVVAAERAMLLGRNDAAYTMFTSLHKASKKDARILMGLAVTQQKLGFFEDAMDSYQKLSEIEPDNLDIKVNMLGLLGTKYPSVALRRLLELHNNNTANSGLTAQVGIAFANSGDTQSAVRYLGMAASMAPRNPGHLYNMAVIFDRAGDAREAIKYYEQALEVDALNGSGGGVSRTAIYERLANIR